MSSQDQLLEIMFPKAKSIKWTEGIPELKMPSEMEKLNFPRQLDSTLTCPLSKAYARPKGGQDPFGALSMALVTQEEMTTMV